MYTPVLKSRLIASVGLQEWASKRPRVANDGTRKMTRDIVIDIGFSEKELRQYQTISVRPDLVEKLNLRWPFPIYRKEIRNTRR